MPGGLALNVEVEGLSCRGRSRKTSKQCVLPVKEMENVRLENKRDFIVGMGVGVEFRWSEKNVLSLTKAGK